MNSQRICALYNNITTGIFHGCMCVKENFMEPYIKGTIKPTATCVNYALNGDKMNCRQIIDFLPQALEASVSTGVLCLLASGFYFLVMIRAGFCPRWCVFADKQIMPITDPDGKYAAANQETDEAKYFRELKEKMLKDKEEKVEKINIAKMDLAHLKVEKKEATPLYLAYYAVNKK